MSKALVVAIALVAIAIPTAATAQTTAVKPLVVSITAVNGRPVGGIEQVTVKKGRLVRLRHSHERRQRAASARL